MEDLRERYFGPSFELQSHEKVSKIYAGLDLHFAKQMLQLKDYEVSHLRNELLGFGDICGCLSNSQRV